MLTQDQIMIVRWARRFAPDVGFEELAVSVGARLSDVRRAARGVKPESESKMRVWRRAVGALAERLAQKGEKFPAIAAMAGISRQHLVTCRREAREQGTVQP